MIDSLKTRYPNAYKNFLLIKNGSSRFFWETTLLLKTKTALFKDPNYIQKMTWKEMEIYRNLPRDWKKVFPVILISSLPFLNYIVLPLAFFYPERLLCRHFWSTSQQLAYGERALIKKRPLNDAVLNGLLIHSDKFLNDQKAKNILIDTIKKTQSGANLSNGDIMELRPILNRPDFNLNKLSSSHLQNLAILNNCSRIYNMNPLNSLTQYAFWLIESDKLLRKENLMEIEKRYIIDFCFERGINANEMTIDEAINYVKARLEFSKLIEISNEYKTQNDYTLILHSNALLADRNSASHRKKLKIQNL